MPPTPRYLLTRGQGPDAPEVGALFDMPVHGQVCLHTEDAEVVLALERAGVLEPGRPPFLDAAEGGVHGAYRPRPQVNVFFPPPVDDVAEAIAPPLREAGFAVRAAAAAG